MQRINSSDIVQGKPLGFNCYDGNGVLLLRRGQVIGSQKQLAALLERGLFAAEASATPAAAPADPGPARATTPFSMMERCKDQVRSLFARIRACCGAEVPAGAAFAELAHTYRQALNNLDRSAAGDFPDQIMNLCKGIQTFCKFDEDAAIGAVHLDAVCRYSTVHAMHKAVLSEVVAARLGIPAQLRLPILAAALTANVSIIGLQEALHAQNRKPTEAEQELIRIHPELSVEMLRQLGVRDDTWLEAVAQHHEKADGSGYPGGIQGAAIARGAQILALADVYGTLVTPRAYREGAPGNEVLRKMFLNRGEMAEADVVQVFIKALGIYPPGTFVRLENGETAIVTRRGTSAAAPKVKSVRDALGMPLAQAYPRDTAQRPFAISATIPRDRRMAINFHSLWDYGFAA